MRPAADSYGATTPHTVASGPIRASP
jgi:hypothetical protein